jgi:hypothetical protein
MYDRSKNLSLIVICSILLDTIQNWIWINPGNNQKNRSTGTIQIYQVSPITLDAAIEQLSKQVLLLKTRTDCETKHKSIFIQSSTNMIKQIIYLS